MAKRNDNSSELYHFGIKGMKWGVRRYENEDGTLTPEGKKRYGVDYAKDWKSRKQQMAERSSELREKASRRHKLEELEEEKRQEDDANYRKRDAVNRIYGTDDDDLDENQRTIRRKKADRLYDDWKKTDANERYSEATKKAEDYVDRKMREEYGESYDTWKKESATMAAVALGGAFIASFGITVYTTLKHER